MTTTQQPEPTNDPTFFVGVTTSGTKWHLNTEGSGTTLCGANLKWNHEDNDWTASHTHLANCPKCLKAAGR